MFGGERSGNGEETSFDPHSPARSERNAGAELSFVLPLARLLAEESHGSSIRRCRDSAGDSCAGCLLAAPSYVRLSQQDA